MLRKGLCGLAYLAVTSALCSAQTNGKASFEVVAIKRAPTVPLRSDAFKRIRIDQAQVNISSISALDLLAMAFRIFPSRLDAPAWTSSTAFEIRAKLPQNAAVETLPDMLQSVCVERLGLVFHRESRIRPVYALEVVDKKIGRELTTAASAVVETTPSGSSNRIWTPLGTARMVSDGQGPPKMVGEGFRMIIGDRELQFEFETVNELIKFLSLESDRPIIDKTELKGLYHISVTVAMGGPARSHMGDDSSSSPLDIYSDSLTKMGLRLVPSKALVEMVVVDGLNRFPTDN